MGEHSSDKLLTRDEVAKQLRMSADTLRRLIAAGDFPRPVQNGKGGWVWTQADVDAHLYRLLNGHRFRAAAPAADDTPLPPDRPRRRRKEKPEEGG